MTYPINGNRGRGGLSIRQFVLHIKDWLTEALSGKQDTLEFDDAPTAGSTNPVTSGGVKTALDGKLSLTGGEMTGNVVVSGRTGTAGGFTTVVSSGQYAKGVNPPETEWHLLAVAVEVGDYTAADSTGNSKRYGFVETAVNPDGSVFTQIVATKNLAGNSQQVSIRVGWDSAGNAFAEAAGHEVERINSSGTDWIRFDSGIQFCWARTDFSSGMTWTYPKSFTSKPVIQLTVDYGANSTEKSVWYGQRSTTSLKIYFSSSGTLYVNCLAFGWWK